MEPAFADLVLKYGLVGAIFAAAASKALSYIFRERSAIADSNLQTADKKARIDIIELLQLRMSDLEKEQRELRTALDHERAARAEAEDLVDRLSRRVTALERRNHALEAQIRRLGHEPE